MSSWSGRRFSNAPLWCALWGEWSFESFLKAAVSYFSKEAVHWRPKDKTWSLFLLLESSKAMIWSDFKFLEKYQNWKKNSVCSFVLHAYISFGILWNCNISCVYLSNVANKGLHVVSYDGLFLKCLTNIFWSEDFVLVATVDGCYFS